MNTEMKFNIIEMFNMFFKTLSDVSSYSQAKLLKDILEIFGLENLDTSITDNWFKRNNISFRKYFNSATLSKELFSNCYKYLKESVDSDYLTLQNSFKEYSTLFNYIDFKTSNSDVFFISFLKQFLHIVDIP